MSMPTWKAASRITFDQDYLDSGCTLAYDDQTGVDNTVGTYATNFVIAGVCFTAAAKLFKCRGDQSHVPDIQEPPGLHHHGHGHVQLSLFYLFTAVSFLVGAVNHLIVERKDDVEKHVTERISYSFYGIASILLFHFGMKLLGVTRTSDGNLKKIIWWSFTVSSLIVLTYFIAIKSILFVGIFNIVTCLFMIIVYILQSCEMRGQGNGNTNERKNSYLVLKVLGVVTMIVGPLLQVFLSPTCGHDAYETCFEDCPLPDPTVFNHNALFHVVYMFGLIILACVEVISPSIVAKGAGSKTIEEIRIVGDKEDA